MRRFIMLIVGVAIGGLFTACPKQEVKTNPMLRIQGHVYDNLTKEPVADAYVGLRLEYYQEPYGHYARTELATTTTDKSGFYSIQCSVDSEACQGAKLSLYPPGSPGDHPGGTRIQCTESWQTVDHK